MTPYEPGPTPPLAELARLLPDLPQWVEVRAMLLTDRATIIGPVATAPPAFVALHAHGDLAVVVGSAAASAIAAAAESAEEFLVAPADEAWVARVLPQWTIEPATLYTRPHTVPIPVDALHAVRFVAIGEVDEWLHLPVDLREELLQELRDDTPVAAAFEGELPVAFGYAGSITERWWDVSIDTLEPFRRRGYAQRVVHFLCAYYDAKGKAPVWGALESNVASASLAGRLGFTPVGSLLVMTAPDIGR